MTGIDFVISKRFGRKLTAAVLSVVICFTGGMFSPVETFGADSRIDFTQNVSTLIVLDSGSSLKRMFTKRYITYELGGITYDSRNMSPEVNLRAFEGMSDKDKKKVFMFMDYEEKTEVFGDRGAAFISDWNKGDTGMDKVQAAVEMMEQVASAGSELTKIYGKETLDSGEVIDHYEENKNGWSYIDHVAYPEAYEIFNSTGYMDDPEAIELRNHMDVAMAYLDAGKQSYDSMVNAYSYVRRNGVKAMSKFCLELITDNFFTPNITPKVAGAATSAWVAFTNYVDSTFKLSDRLWRNKYLTDGAADAAKVADVASTLQDLIKRNREFSQQCAVECEAEYRYVMSEAPAVIEKINKRREAEQKIINKRMEEDDIRVDSISQASDDTTKNNDVYDALTQSKITGLTDSDFSDISAFLSQLKAKRDTILLQYETLNNEIKSFNNGVKGKVSSILSDAGYDVYEGEEGVSVYEASMRDKKDYFMVSGITQNDEIDDLEVGSSCNYCQRDLWENRDLYMGFVTLPDEALAAFKEDKEAQRAEGIRTASMDITVSNRALSAYDWALETYRDLVKKRNAYNEAVEEAFRIVDGSLPNIKREYDRFMAFDPENLSEEGQSNYYFIKNAYETASACLGEISERRSLRLSANGVYQLTCFPMNCTDDDIDNINARIDEEIEEAVNENKKYKAWLSDRVDDYMSLQNDFDLAYVDYCNALAECKKIIGDIPDYVKTEAAHSSVEILRNADNSELNEILDKAGDRGKALKREGDKLKGLYDAYQTASRSMNIDRSLMESYYSLMTEIEGCFNFTYVYNEEIGGQTYTGKSVCDLFDVSYPSLIFEYDSETGEAAVARNWFYSEKYKDLFIQPDDLKAVRFLPLFYQDFFGGGRYQENLVEIYNKMRMKKGHLMRQLSAGNRDEFDSLKSEFVTAYNTCVRNSYNKGIANPGQAREIDFSEELYGAGGLVNRIYSAIENYKPVKRLIKGGEGDVDGTDEGDVQDTDELVLSAGTRQRLYAVVEPEDATDKTIIWTSSDSQIVKTGSDGTVVALSPGSVTVYARALDAPVESSLIEYEAVDEYAGFSAETYSIPDDYIAAYDIRVTGEPVYEKNFMVSFEPASGSGTMDSVSVNGGAPLILPSCGFGAPEGMVFAGWNLGLEGDVIYVASDMTVKALWEDKKSDSSGSEKGGSSSSEKDDGSSTEKGDGSSSEKGDSSGTEKGDGSSTGKGDGSGTEKDDGSGTGKGNSSSSSGGSSRVDNTSEMKIITQPKGSVMILGDEARIELPGIDGTLISADGKSGTYDSATGCVKAVSKGTIKLKAAVTDAKGKTRQKTVCKIKVEAPKINKAVLSLKQGKRKKLKLAGLKSAAPLWSASDETVAAVDSGGTVSAVGPGTCVIYAAVKGYPEDHVYECTVTVKSDMEKGSVHQRIERVGIF